MGYDDNTPLKGVTGGGLPAEIWHEVMLRVHEGVPPTPLPLIVPAPLAPPPMGTEPQPRPPGYANPNASLPAESYTEPAYDPYAAPAPLPDLGTGRRVLVVGQVEDDASIRLGAGTVQTNLGLLTAAAQANPGDALSGRYGCPKQPRTKPTVPNV